MEKIANFIDFLRFEKRYSTHTLAAYQTDLFQFSSFLQNEFGTSRIEEAGASSVRSFMASLMESGISARSIARKLNTCRSFYKYLIQEGVILKNPMAAITAPKVPSRLPAFADERTMKQVSDIPVEDSFTGIRNRLIITMLYHTGMRLSELVNLKTENADLQKLELKVLGKRNKERIIPITRELAGDIAHYLSAKNALKQADTRHLLVLDNGKKLYAKFVYRTVSGFFTLHSSLEKKNPHMLRHTYATHMLSAGADIQAIKEILGHSSLAATQVYTHNNIEQLKKAHKNAHPRS